MEQHEHNQNNSNNNNFNNNDNNNNSNNHNNDNINNSNIEDLNNNNDNINNSNNIEDINNNDDKNNKILIIKLKNLNTLTKIWLSKPSLGDHPAACQPWNDKILKWKIVSGDWGTYYWVSNSCRKSENKDVNAFFAS